jgi:hypothetical protein
VRDGPPLVNAMLSHLIIFAYNIKAFQAQELMRFGRPTHFAARRPALLATRTLGGHHQ